MKAGNDSDVPEQVLSLDPSSASAIRQLFHSDEPFRELCDDYTECRSLLNHLRAEQGGGGERIEQLRELCADLEHELLICFKRPAKAPDSPAPVQPSG